MSVHFLRSHLKVSANLSLEGSWVSRLVINSGAKSEGFLKALYPELPPQAFVQYGNFIGDALKIASELKIEKVTLGVMVGKAVKLAEGFLDTHSKNVMMNKEFLKQLAAEAGCSDSAGDIIEKITWLVNCGLLLILKMRIFFSLCYRHVVLRWLVPLFRRVS